MRKESVSQEKLLKGLQSELKTLQSELIVANKIAGIDEYINVKVKKNQARFMRIKRKDEDDKAVGKFLIQIDITSKQDTVFVPISIASGKKQTGFIYQIEGTGEGSISTANVACKGGRSFTGHTWNTHIF